MALAIFDLDNTLLEGDSDYSWGQFLVERRLVDQETYTRENARYYADYQAGTLDIHEFLAFALRPLAQHDREMLERLHREFMQSRVLPMIRPAARALVDHHRRRGDTPLIITATNSFVTRPIAAEFGIEHLLATTPEECNGRFTGRVDGVPCFREGKVARLEEWLESRDADLAGSWFYTDSHNDLPLLDRVTHPVAVDPDPILNEEAQRRGWPILSLR